MAMDPDLVQFLANSTEELKEQYQPEDAASVDESAIELHACGYCGKEFRCLGNLKVHYRIHKDERPYPCHYCNKAFRTTSHLKKHVATHTGEKAHVCGVCGKGFIQKSNLVVHERTHTGKLQRSKKGVKCSVCPSTFSSHLLMMNHLQTHLMPKEVEKPVDAEIRENSAPYISKTSWEDDGPKIIKEEPLEESEYPDEVASLTDADCNGNNNRLNEETSPTGKNEKPQLSVRKDLNNDIADSLLLMTEQCNSNLVQRPQRLVKKTVQAGGMLHIRDEWGQFICSVCDKKFNTSSRLKRHVATHTGEKNFACKHCGREFIQKGNLVVHLKVHHKDLNTDNTATVIQRTDGEISNGSTGEINNGCVATVIQITDGDTLNFTPDGDLVPDVRVKVECSIENEGFLEDLPSEKEKFRCDVCGKEFVKKGNLANHLKTHEKTETTQNDTTVAAADDEEMANVNAFIPNIKVEVEDPLEDVSLEENILKCDPCGKEFTSKSSLVIHMKSHYETDTQNGAEANDEEMTDLSAFIPDVEVGVEDGAHNSAKRSIESESCNGDDEVAMSYNQSDDELMPLAYALEMVQDYCKDGGERLQMALEVIGSALSNLNP